MKELRRRIAPVSAKDVVIYNSDDEDARKDLLLKRKLSLARGRKIAREKQLRASRLLAALERKEPSQQIHVSDLLELAKENIPAPSSAIASTSTASLAPLRCCTASTADAALHVQEKRGRLALHRKPLAKSVNKSFVGPSSECSNLMATAGAVRSSLVESADDLFTPVSSPPFFFHGDFSESE